MRSLRSLRSNRLSTAGFTLGFTLTECMVALVLLTVAVGALQLVLTQYARQTRQINSETRQTWNAQNNLEIQRALCATPPLCQ